jgi:putative ABC transport system substrate-binding protein
MWASAAQAQQAPPPIVGFPAASTDRNWTMDSRVQRLRELGWIEGRTVATDDRWPGGRSERFAEIAAEFVRLKAAAA